MIRSTFVAALVLALSFDLSGQSGTATLSGYVTDPSGATLPGADVELLRQDAGLLRRTRSDAIGYFHFAAVPPGRYLLQVKAPQFQSVRTTPFELPVDTRVRQDLSLPVRGPKELVEVHAGTRRNAADASIGHVLGRAEVANLPLEANNPLTLLLVQPGVTYGAALVDRRSGAVAGARSDQTSLTLDGTDANHQEVQRPLVESAVPIPLDSIQEFRFTTSNPPLDQGRSSGGQIAFVTRSGTNSLRGSLFWNHRSTATAANDWFNKRNQLAGGLPNRPLDRLRNIFGVAAGGPVKKDRLFFFAVYEGTRTRQQLAWGAMVPSDAMREGTLRYRDNTGAVATLSPSDLQTIDPAGIGVNPAMLALMNDYPRCSPPLEGIDSGLNFCRARWPAAVAADLNTYVLRLDHQLSRDGRHSLFWRGTLGNTDNEILPAQLPGQASAQRQVENRKGSTLSYTHQFSPRALGIFRYGFTRMSNNLAAHEGAGIFINGLTPPFPLDRGRVTLLPAHNLVEDVTLVRNSHTLQWGGTLRLIRNQQVRFSGAFPTYLMSDFLCAGACNSVPQSLGPSGAHPQYPAVSDSSLLSLRSGLVGLYGMITSMSGTYVLEGNTQRLAPESGIRRAFLAREWELYVQDSWRVRPSFTFTYGVRYSYYGVPYEERGLQTRPTVDLHDWFRRRITAQDAGTPSSSLPLLTWELAGPAVGRSSYYQPDRNNLSPGVGFAYAPGQSGPLARIIGRSAVLRGGARMVYDRIGNAFPVFTDQSAVGLVNPVRSPAHRLDYSGPPCTTPPSSVCAAPRFTSLSSLPSIADFTTAPSTTFPFTPAPVIFNSSFLVDSRLRTPYTYMFSLAYGRELPWDVSFEAAYVRRSSHKLLTKLDLAAPMVLFRDPASGMTYADAMNQLYRQSARGSALGQDIAPIPFFEQMFPSLAATCPDVPACTATQGVYLIAQPWMPSFTDILLELEPFSRFPHPTFFQQQFVSLPAWTNFGGSSYHGLQLSARRDVGRTVFSLHYTFSKSIDNSSAIEAAPGPFLQLSDSFRPRRDRAVSDFDVTHQLAGSFVYPLPLGSGQPWGASWPSVLRHAVSGWTVSGIVRWRGALPFSISNGPYFPTNWLLPGSATQTCPIAVDVARGSPGGPNVFGGAEQANAALRCVEFTLAGESGSRNSLRGARYFNLDTALAKTFVFPREGHRISFRWEAFNAFNNVNLDDRSIALDPSEPSSFGRYNGAIPARVMQFALRYQF